MSRLVINKVSEEPEKEYLRSAKNILLGRKRPPFFTRIILLVALLAFVYYFFWNGLRVIVFSPGTTDIIDDPQVFEARITKLGELYGIADAKITFLHYGQLMMVSWLVVLVGMMIIYRRKLFGYYIFFLGLLSALLTPFIILGWDYASDTAGGTDVYDHIIPPSLFIIFFISYRRLKRLKKVARREALSNL